MTGLLLAAAGALPLLLAQQPGTTSTTNPCGSNPTEMCTYAGDTWGEGAAQFVNIFDQPIEIVLIILVAWVVNRLARTFIKRTLNRAMSDRSQRVGRVIRKATPNVLLRTESVNLRLEARVQALTTVLRSIASVTIWFIAGLAVLSTLGLNLTTLVAPASIIGVALGFGAQNIVKDFLAGIFIVVEDQFGVGDVVDIGGDAKGTVEQLTLRSTRVRDVNGTVWHVPNGQIVRAANKSQEWARALLDIEVDGTTEYDKVAGIVQQVAEQVAAHPRWMVEIIETPELWGVESFTEKGYTVRLVVKTRPASQFGVMRELRIRLLAAFRDEGIILPGDQWATEQHEAIEALRTAAHPGPAHRTASAAVRPVENESEPDPPGHDDGGGEASDGEGHSSSDS